MRSLSRILDISCLCPYHLQPPIRLGLHLSLAIVFCVSINTLVIPFCVVLSLYLCLYLPPFLPLCFCLFLFLHLFLSSNSFFSFSFSRLINHSYFLLLFFSDSLLYLLHHVWLCLSLSIFFLCRLLRFHSLLPSLLSKSLYLYLFLYLFVRSLSMPMTVFCPSFISILHRHLFLSLFLSLPSIFHL